MSRTFLKNAVLIGAIFLGAASCNVFGTPGVLGVVKTLDAGGNWQPADTITSSTANISNLIVAEMNFDPQNRQTIYLAAVNSGLWQSTDAAKTWKQILNNLSVLDSFVDPTNSQIIFAAGTFAGHGRIIETTDGGKTWNEQYLEASTNNAVNSITANPNNPNELYAGLNSGVLIKS